MSLAIFFHFFIRSLRLFCWITTLVVLFLVRCVLEVQLQPATRIPLQPNHTETPTHIETRKHDQCGDKIEKSQAPDDGCINVRNMLSFCYTDTTPTQRHRNSNTHRTKNNTTSVVIQQNSRKLLMMDILMSETCWAYKKWNKMASDI